MLVMIELLDQPLAFQGAEDPDHGSAIIPNPSVSGMPCTVLARGGMA
jgi:hypothetical protein